jgi:glyoxylase-like metal-dependent hydrolase (beta-lactamase superfamily II)
VSWPGAPPPGVREHPDDDVTRITEADMSSSEATGTLTYDVFVNDPPPQHGVLPNGEPKLFSPMASTLIYGSNDGVLTDPGMTEDQARALGDWVAGKGRNLTDIFITPRSR